MLFENYLTKAKRIIKDIIDLEKENYEINKLLIHIDTNESNIKFQRLSLTISGRDFHIDNKLVFDIDDYISTLKTRLITNKNEIQLLESEFKNLK